MTEQEYMKLVTYHKEKQKEAEDEAYLLKKEIERLRKRVAELDDIAYWELQQENERLRKIIDRIVDTDYVIQTADGGFKPIPMAEIVEKAKEEIG